MKISIITINYNNCEGLHKTIESVVNQTWKEFEWIIIDGGSTDGSRELIEQTAATCKELEYWCSEKDKGIYNAMNKGIEKASGEYCLFLNSGDSLYRDDVLQNVIESTLDADVVYGDSATVADKGDRIWHQPDNLSLLYMADHVICHQTMFIRTDVLKKLPYDDVRYKIVGDRARWLRLLFDGGTFRHIPLVICYYDEGGISSTTSERWQKERDDVFGMLPVQVADVMKQYVQTKKRLLEFEDSPLTCEVHSLINARPIYCKLIHAAVLIVRMIKSVAECVSKEGNRKG